MTPKTRVEDRGAGGASHASKGASNLSRADYLGHINGFLTPEESASVTLLEEVLVKVFLYISTTW